MWIHVPIEIKIKTLAKQVFWEVDVKVLLFAIYFLELNCQFIFFSAQSLCHRHPKKRLLI